MNGCSGPRAAEWEVRAVNEIDEPIYATPALADQRIYVRTPTSLYSFGGGG